MFESLELFVGQTIDLDTILNNLSAFHYRREKKTVAEGEFSLRGGRLPYRIKNMSERQQANGVNFQRPYTIWYRAAFFLTALSFFSVALSAGRAFSGEIKVSTMIYKADGVEAHWRGIYDDKGRVMVAISFNSDIGDSWEWANDPRYPQKFSDLGIRIGVNYVIYDMTH